MSSGKILLRGDMRFFFPCVVYNTVFYKKGEQRNNPFNLAFYMYNAESTVFYNQHGVNAMTAKNKSSTPTNEVPFEHERRFFPRLQNLPFALHRYPMITIIQGYLGDTLNTRLRDEQRSEGKHTYTQTRKIGEGVSRREDEHEISKEEFQQGWKMIECSLMKDRYFINWKGVDLQLNIFSGDLARYLQIEVEFISKESAVAFIPPKWFGREVTHDKQHGNYSLAKFGMPK